MFSLVYSFIDRITQGGCACGDLCQCGENCVCTADSKCGPRCTCAL